MSVAVVDLDRTLIFSRTATGVPDEGLADLTCVEVYRDRPLSYVTRTAADQLGLLAASGRFVPVTTRTVEQYLRIRLPGPTPHLALCANGGRLLVDGVEDPGFTAEVTTRLAGAPTGHDLLVDLERVCRDGLEGPDPRVHLVRQAEGLFAYVVLARAGGADDLVEAVVGLAAERDCVASVQGRKVYVVPRALSKSVAVGHVLAQWPGARLLAAGDSLLDAALLDAADEAMVPRGSGLEAAGWSRPHARLTREPGVAAGEEIVAWLSRGLLGGPSDTVAVLSS